MLRFMGGKLGIQGARTAARILGKDTGPALTLRLAEELSTQVNAVLDGDLSRAESMLVTQAHTLDALFNSLLRAAMSIEGTPYFEQYLRVALKAQSQARTSLEALGRIKNPTVAFVKQANDRAGNATGKQLRGLSRGPRRESRKRNSAKQSFGGRRWRSPGHLIGGPGKRP